MSESIESLSAIFVGNGVVFPYYQIVPPTQTNCFFLAVRAVVRRHRRKVYRVSEESL